MPATRRPRRTYSDIFLEKLKELSDGGKTLVSNRALRDALEWDELRYARIKELLRTETRIIVGRGYGGTVGLSTLSEIVPLKAFISYTHKDRECKNDLLRHLKPLERLSLIDTWDDQQITAGDTWDKTISEKLDSADIILLLVSVDFINSKYCYENEMEKALERNEEGKACVIPIIFRNCLWQFTPFAKLQAVPRDAKAIDSWDSIDDALVDVANRIREAAEGLLSRR